MFFNFSDSRGMKTPKSQKPSEFKGEISKNRKNPHNLKDFFEKFSSRGGSGGTKIAQRRACSRLTFDCLDKDDRLSHFKTPMRTQSVGIDSNYVSTPKRSKQPRRTCRAPQSSLSRRRKRPGPENESPTSVGAKPSLSKRPAKRALVVAPCDIWSGNKHICRYCRVVLSNQPSESHLLYHCTGIPNSKPLSKSNRRFPKGLMKRLAEISAVPDPGGEIVGGTL